MQPEQSSVTRSSSCQDQGGRKCSDKTTVFKKSGRRRQKQGNVRTGTLWIGFAVFVTFMMVYMYTLHPTLTGPGLTGTFRFHPMTRKERTHMTPASIKRRNVRVELSCSQNIHHRIRGGRIVHNAPRRWLEVDDYLLDVFAWSCWQVETVPSS
jgi:hypothetical protein